ncbi:MAG: choice-of-anchor V domain-containing protein [Candidatus Thermoplasmatota archaeon]
MKLNLVGRGAVVALLMALALASQVSGNFAASPGFSGRAGVTCIACHTVAPVGYVEADAVLEGFPASWEPGKEYAVTIAVTGGPQAMPAPQPQGGFDLDVGAGTLVLPPGTEDTLRLVNGHEATYRPAGTLMRQWTVSWVAPGLDSYPAPVPVWLAVVAANGNHVVATNTSDGGERFDSTASLQLSVPPAPAAFAAWRALPLLAPHANASYDGDGSWTLDGRHMDANATRLLWSVDGGPWQARDTAATWKLRLDGLDGDHTVRLRSEGLERASPDVSLPIAAPGLFDSVGGGRSSPAPSFLPLLAIAFVLTLRRCLP